MKSKKYCSKSIEGDEFSSRGPKTVCSLYIERGFYYANISYVYITEREARMAIQKYFMAGCTTVSINSVHTYRMLDVSFPQQ